MEFRSYVIRWCPPFFFVLYYSTNFLKFFPTISLTLSLSSGLTSENVSKENSPQEAHVNARSKQSELELELIQTQMTQKPMLRAEVYARALRASQNRKEDSL